MMLDFILSFELASHSFNKHTDLHAIILHIIYMWLYYSIVLSYSLPLQIDSSFTIFLPIFNSLFLFFLWSTAFNQKYQDKHWRTGATLQGLTPRESKGLMRSSSLLDRELMDTALWGSFTDTHDCYVFMNENTAILVQKTVIHSNTSHLKLFHILSTHSSEIFLDHSNQTEITHMHTYTYVYVYLLNYYN